MGTEEKIIEKKKNPVISDLTKTCAVIWLGCVLVIICVVVFSDNNIKMIKDITEYIGSNHNAVAFEFEKLGFTTIEVIELEDLVSSNDVKVGTVESIAIGDITSFTINDEFSPDERIVISYHTVKKIEVPFSSEIIQEYKCNEIAELFKNAEFSNVEIKEIYDLDPDEYEEEYINEVFINSSTYFTESEEYPIDAKVVIISHYPYEKYTVKLHIDFIPNLLFNKYDVDVWVNGEKKYTLAHGEDGDCEFRLKKGTNTIAFISSENEEVHEDITWDVNCDIEGEYELWCYRNSIDLEEEYVDYKVELAENEVKMDASMYDYTGYNYENVHKELEKLGFENIVLKPQYDIFFGITKEGSVSEVAIDGKTDYKRGDILSKEAEVVVVYSMSYEKDPDYIVMKYGSHYYEGENYIEVQNEFEELGFSDITLDIYYTSDTTKNDGDVSAVNIDGDDFEEGDRFHKDKKIMIRYYIINENEEGETEKSQTSEVENESAVFYSSNDYETAKKGNTGVFSYRYKGGSYDIYWIIDFDEGYVYYFTDGNGEETCDRLKIESGDLNSNLVITYHDGGDEWSYGLHFKYVNHPETLIMIDNDGFDYKYSTTDLEDALYLKSTKTIKDY